MNRIPSKVQRIKRLLLIILITIAALFLIVLGSVGSGCSSGEIGSIKLVWDPNTDPDVAGYKVYYGTSPGKYGPGIAVGNVTTFVLNGLIKRQKYYLAITAYNKAGKESKFSTEIIGIAK